jgi:hypothetical protein
VYCTFLMGFLDLCVCVCVCGGGVWCGVVVMGGIGRLWIVKSVANKSNWFLFLITDVVECKVVIENEVVIVS